MTMKATTTTHTPGPWYSDTRPDTSIEIQDRVGIPVCVMTLRLDKRANARLISAAPDLLAALEKLLENAENMVKYIDVLNSVEKFDPQGNAQSYDSPEMAAARAVIVKAKGLTQD